MLLKPARRCSATLRAALGRLQTDLGNANSGDLIDVPDFEAVSGVSVHDLIAAIQGPHGQLQEDQRNIAHSVFILAGKAARVWRDNQTGAAVLSYKDTLPDDLRPLLVLDASGSVRHTYADMAQFRDLTRLREARKDYSPLTVHVWKRGGGESAFQSNRSDLTKGIAETIMTKPDDKWLVVIHRRDKHIGDIERDIRRQLPTELSEKVSMISWGNHMATNGYKDVPNVILAGTLFMRDSYYLALTHLCQDRPTEPGLASADEVRRTRHGEHADLVLQALCRGRVRKSNGSRCFPMDAYIIASVRSGIPDMLPSVFPGCDVKDWQPLRREAGGYLGKAIAWVKVQVSSGMTQITYKAIQGAIGLPPKGKNFGKLVTSRPEWIAELDAMGLKPFGGVRRMTGIRLVESK